MGVVFHLVLILVNHIKKHNLYICGKSLMYVIGTRIYFTNDKIMGKCGCGVSVRVSVRGNNI